MENPKLQAPNHKQIQIFKFKIQTLSKSVLSIGILIKPLQGFRCQRGEARYWVLFGICDLEFGVWNFVHWILSKSDGENEKGMKNFTFVSIGLRLVDEDKEKNYRELLYV